MLIKNISNNKRVRRSVIVALGIVLVLVVVATLITVIDFSPVKIKLIKKIPVNSFSSQFKNISANRYFLVSSSEWAREEGTRKAISVSYYAVDVVDQRLIKITIPIADFYTQFKKYFRTPPPPEIVFYNGTEVGLVYVSYNRNRSVDKCSPESSTRIYYFVKYNLQTRQFSDLNPMGDKFDARSYIGLAGIDPQDKYLYYYKAESENSAFSCVTPSLIKISRINLETGENDWEFKLDLPQRKNQLHIKKIHLNKDGSKLAVVEESSAHYKKDKGPRVYVVDVETKKMTSFPIPYVAYAVSFSPDGQHLFVSGHTSGEVIRINLIENKIDLQLQGLKKGHHYIISPSENFVMHFISGKSIEFMRISDLKPAFNIPIRKILKNVDTIHGDSLALTYDGKYIIIPELGSQGFPLQKGSIQIFEIIE